MKLEQTLGMYQSRQKVFEKVYTIEGLEYLSASALYSGEKIWLPNGKCVRGEDLGLFGDGTNLIRTGKSIKITDSLTNIPIMRLDFADNFHKDHIDYGTSGKNKFNFERIGEEARSLMDFTILKKLGIDLDEDK